MSLAAELHQAHKERLSAIAAKAAERDAKKQAALIAELKECSNPKPEPEPDPEPEPIEDGWVEQQIKKNKPLWFSVVSAVKVTPSGAPSIRTIQQAVCHVYGVTLADLLSARRSWDIVKPRHVSMFLADELTNLSLRRIAGATGCRNHKATLHAVRKIRRLLKSDARLASSIELIRERVAAGNAAHG